MTPDPAPDDTAMGDATPGDTAARLRRLLVEEHGVEPQRIADAASWSAMGLDSLDEAELEIATEALFGLSDEALSSGGRRWPATFGALVAAVDRLRRPALFAQQAGGETG